ncbi:hypothetical protein KVR01_001092 [Diaporthe batatas]|uniref:uncharacterized protein n=1 Tax=Diaporthe batatas TaxID=748121 RepID=UPI001D04A914|nr:uncharacterized protein KVR01_001092 [Diaporthe batatas]KAG8168343.1 hypothetical protein KVR01_001092 [Diaporthe batatas]
MMSDFMARVASPYRAYRALDDVPTRPATDRPFVGAGLPAQGIDSDQPQSSAPLDRSCSPTPSEIDALEESFCELDIGPSQAELDSSQSSATIVPGNISSAPTVVIWEVTRVALHCGVDVASLDLQYHPRLADLDTLWRTLRNHPSFKGKSFPEKSDPVAWRGGLYNNFECEGDALVMLTATMHLSTSRQGPAMQLELHPLKLEQGSRLLRRFGSDRFLEVRIPSVDTWLAGKEGAAALVADWLANEPHPFMDRHWSAFFVRERSEKSEIKDLKHGQAPRVIFNERVLFFAESGRDLHDASQTVSNLSETTSPQARSACSREAMLDWLLNFDKNCDQSHLKLFSRIALGLSRTSPTVVLEESQIREKAEDILSEKSKDTLSPLDELEVMNDGVARISPSLMRKIRDVLGLQSIPSAIQGRLGSAKGMWMIDTTDLGREDWIETYPKQRKWNCYMSEEAHRTLETLNKQFLPILEDRSKDVAALRQTFVDNLTTRSEEETCYLKEALQHPELFRKWIRGLNPRGSFRITPQGMPFLAGLPESTEDMMSFVVDGGFEPMRLKFLQDMVFQAQKRRGDDLKDELHIKIPKSTYAYMLVDFQGVLEPDEVHLCFSSRFDDGTDELSDLDGMGVLVGRCPAHLPSDIQKVRAVFKPELRHIRDVIVFSSKGNMPLAAKLSGGDYDGDKAWVCWLPELVENFENSDVPEKPDFSPYIEKDTTTLGDLRKLYGETGYVDAMVAKAIWFNLMPKFLGPCTSFKEKLAYDLNSLSDERVIKLSWLLSELADQPKQGILFGRDEWRRFRDDVVGMKRHLSTPRYKASDGSRSVGPGAQHIIDFLSFTARSIVDASLKDLHEFMVRSNAGTTDEDITGYWNRFAAVCEQQHPEWFAALHQNLRCDLEACRGEWSKLVRLDDYRGSVGQVYRAWMDIKPRVPAQAAGGPGASWFLLPDGVVHPELSQWELVKASLAFKLYSGKGRFVWQVAGRQLQAIKALSTRSGGLGNAPVVVVPNMYAALKPDNTYIKRLMASEEEEEGQEGMCSSETERVQRRYGGVPCSWAEE